MNKREVFRSNISAWTRRLGLEKPADIDSVIKVVQKMGLDIGSRFTAMFVVASNYLLTKDWCVGNSHRVTVRLFKGKGKPTTLKVS